MKNVWKLCDIWSASHVGTAFLTEKISYNPDGTVAKETKYEYNDKDQRIKEITSTYEYDENGRVAKMITTTNDLINNIITDNVEDFTYEE